MKKKNETVGHSRSVYLFSRTLKRRRAIEEKYGYEAGKEYWKSMRKKMEIWDEATS